MVYLFEQVPGFLCEVGWEAQFAFKNFVNGFLPVLSSKRWLEGQNTGLFSQQLIHKKKSNKKNC